VKALVYIAAFLPEKGESAVELSGKFPGSTLGEALHPVPVTLPDGSQGTDLYIEQASSTTSSPRTSPRPPPTWWPLLSGR